MDIVNKFKNNPPVSGLFLKNIKNEIIGENYDLSLVFTESRLSSKLNSKYRNKKGPTNVLSFSLGPKEGEIFIDLEKSKKEARHFKIKYKQFVLTLFIHSLLHLKGFQHGKLMTAEENKFKRKYNIG